MELVYKHSVFRKQEFDYELGQHINLCSFHWCGRMIVCDDGDCSTCLIPQYVLMKDSMAR